MSFMQPQITLDTYVEVETTIGTEIVPTHIIGLKPTITCMDAFIEGEIVNPVFEVKTGWLARLTAPGYLDCTDWTAHESEQEAREYLEDCYDISVE